MRRSFALFSILALFSLPVQAGVVFSRTPDVVNGGLNPSSWVPPNGTDSDEFAWDDFTLTETQVITKVTWRGGYILGAPYGHATDFRVSFFDSAANGFQPLITAFPSDEDNETVIATFHTNGLAGESFAGVYGGMVMYDYTYQLPTPVTIQAGKRSWFRVVASQALQPDWGMATGLGGDATHFRYSEGTSMYRNWPHDLAYTLEADWVNLGYALTGTSGDPVLTGSGLLSSGTSTTFSLSSASPSSPAWIVAGASEIDLPLFGGTLVPNLDLIMPLAIDATGNASVVMDLPPGVPPGTDVYFQVWIRDPAASAGFAASNGLMSTTQ